MSIGVVVTPQADNVTVTAQDASGSVGTQIPLNISAQLTDLDGSESITGIVISNLPSSVSLSAGTLISSGSYSLTLAQLSGLTMTNSDDTDFIASVAVSSQDLDQIQGKQSPPPTPSSLVSTWTRVLMVW